jgi:NAD(P)H-flavin reductase
MRSRDIEVVLIYGARNESELLYGEEFEKFAAKNPQFHFYACFSRLPRVQPRAHDRNGHVQVALTEIKPDPANDIAYLCGNPNMVDEAFNLLKESGLPIPHIRREKYVSSR